MAKILVGNLTGPKGDKGDKGADSTVPGPPSTVPGPPGTPGTPGAPGKDGISATDLVAFTAQYQADVAKAVAEATVDLYPDAGYDVVVIMGQSNAQGAAVDFINGKAPDLDPGRVFQYGAIAKDNPRVGAGKITRAIDPLIHPWTSVVGTTTDLVTSKGVGMPFARNYVPTLGVGRKLLLVPAAYSGTGFNKTNHGTEMSTHWRVNDATGVNVFTKAVNQTIAAMAAAGPNARLVAAIWVQGETDEVTAPDSYRTFLLEVIDGFRTKTGWANLPFLIGGMVPEGLAAVPGRAAIDSVHREIPGLRPYTSFSAGPSGMYIDSGLHYNAKGQETLGAAVFAGLAVAKANAPAPVEPPAKVATITAGGAGSRSVPLSWGSADRATSYEVDYKRTSDTAWTTVTTSATSRTISGLVAESSYDFRVRAVNSGGKASYSSVLSVSTIAAGSLLGDLGIQAAHAYGTRKLHKSYSGPAIRVVRTTDSSEMDVLFDANGDLDTAAMMAWATSATVSIKTFYDLTGRGLDLSQSNPTARARLAIGGNVDTIGGRPAPVANANVYYTNTFTGISTYAAGSGSTFAVTYGTATANGRLVAETNSTSASQQYVPIMANVTNGALVSQRITDNSGNTIAADSATTVAFTQNVVQISSIDTGTAFVKRVNGGDAGTVAIARAGTATFDTLCWGGLFRNGAFGAPIGTRPIELILFQAALSDTDRNLIEANQKSYFGIA